MLFKLLHVEYGRSALLEDNEHLDGGGGGAGTGEELADVAAGGRALLIALVDSEGGNLDGLERRDDVILEHLLKAQAQSTLQGSRRHARLGRRELHLQVEERHAVLRDVEGLGHHGLGGHIEGNRRRVDARGVLLERVSGSLEQHPAAGPVLVERDEREEVDLLRN
eukprot:2476398-Rhodomonas_salina.1